MEQPNKYISVAYELYTDNEKGIHELMEKAPVEHPFQFISGLGVALDAFESHIAALNEGDNFDFTLSVDEAYGPRMSRKTKWSLTSTTLLLAKPSTSKDRLSLHAKQPTRKSKTSSTE